MNVLIDHSGYDLLNVGDVAMLQSCVRRLQRLLPGARFSVLCYDADQLARYCPGVDPVVLELPAVGNLLPRRARRTLEAGVKAFDPMSKRTSRANALSPAGQMAAGADLVVASGGGYLTDAFLPHGLGVLETLAVAQSHGRPTAMFGQGIGPMTNRMLIRRARSVLPRLRVLGLREAAAAAPLLDDFALAPRSDHRCLTGDDALSLVAGSPGQPTGNAVGVNLRVASYAGIDDRRAHEIAATIRAAADGAELVVLPVSRYSRHDDLKATLAAIGGAEGSVAAIDVRDPGALVAQVARCRIVVTASYHAAVFALAQGIPAVCVTSAGYYDGKFHGLKDLYGTACTGVDLRQPDWRRSLEKAMGDALEFPESTRRLTIARTHQLVRACDALYERFVNSL